jgi:hypothetical protein
MPEESERTHLVRIAESTNGGSESDASEVLESLLSKPGSAARRLARSEAIEGVQVLARGREPLPVQPIEGDVLIRLVEGGTGHAAVVASRGLTQSADGEGYVHVVERFPVARNAAEGFNRRVTDTAGRLLEDLILLRLVMPNPPSPTVVKVETPAAAPPSDQPVKVSVDPLLTTPTEAVPAEPSCDHIESSRLTWAGASSDQLDLMRTVYIRQVTAACQSRSFIADVPASELAEIEGGVSARREAAASCRNILAAARAALAADPSNPPVTGIGVLSGYRSASRQFANWNRNFPRYYRETQSDRAAAAGGEFGDAAVALLTRYISRRLAAPGFSLHNDGRAVDFSTVDRGRSLGADTSAASRTAWRSSWLFNWLSANANRYGFFQNTSIDEPWHWEFRGSATSALTQSVESVPQPDTVEPEDLQEAAAIEATIAEGRLELSSTPLLARHRGTQPDLILRWNGMTDPSSVDVVVHLHGYSSDKQSMRLTNKEAYSGLNFSNPDNPSDTRLGRSTPTLGILPRGSYTGDTPGANPERYTFPELVKASGIRDLISYSFGQFTTATGTAATTGKLIITAHSGGGAALMGALANNNPDEIHTFDALYTDASPLITWANAHIAAEIQAWTPGKTKADGGMCVLYRRRGTETQSLRVHRAVRAAIDAAPTAAQPVLRAAYRVLRTSVSHGEIPRRFGWLLLADVTQPLTDSAPAESEPAEDTEAEYPSVESVEPEGLAEALGPEGATLETFPNIDSCDHEQFIKVKLFRESIDSATFAFKEEPVLDSADFASFQTAELAAIKGSKAVASPAAGQANYELRWKARVYYPRGSKPKQLPGKRAFPVVFIIHGQHDWLVGTKEVENHLGYEYLQQDLAHHGIVSVSINTNPANLLGSLIRTRAEFVTAGFQIMKGMNEDPKNHFYKRLDLRNIGIMGHSRGGDGITKAAILNRGNPDFTVRAVCSLAPTDYSGTARAADRTALKDSDRLHYLVLYGSHDGDVGGHYSAFGGTGFRHYDRATCARTMAFVHGAKHDRFNTNWDNQTNYSDPSDCVTTDPDWLLPADHRQLAIDYIGGLFRFVLNREQSLAGLFDGSAAPSGAHEISLQWSPPTTPRIFSIILHGTPVNPGTTWTKGWSTLMPFRLPGQDLRFELAYKKDTGDVAIDRLDPKTGADILWKDKWRTGWTHFMPFNIPGDDRVHELVYMAGTGEVAIDRIWKDGKGVDVNIWKDKWSTGWTTFIPVHLPGDDKPYFLSYKQATGDVSIDRILEIGKGTKSVYSAKWTPGWTTFLPFDLPGDNRQYYLSYKKETGEAVIDLINADAGVKTIWHDQWHKGWSVFVLFHVPGDDRPHYFAYRGTDGDVIIGRIRRDGMGVDTLLQERWTKNWTSFVSFEVDGKACLLAYKSGSGDVSFGRLLPDVMLGVDDFEGTNPALNSLGGAAVSTSISPLLFQRGAVAPPNTIPHQTRVLKGTAAGAKYRADIPAANRNLTGFDLITFRLINEFKLAPAVSGDFIDFKVSVSFGTPAGGTLSDQVDQTSLDTTGVRVRQRPYFRKISEPAGCVSGTKLTLQTLAIPFARFTAVNWQDVRAIEFEAGPNVPRPFYFDSLAVVQS